MAANSPIQWCHHTFNPWWGCTKVSPACDYCYAETDAKRYGHPDLWGPEGRRRTFSDGHWRGPLLWNEQATHAGVRYRVFCASMADVLDKDGPPHERARLWNLIRATPKLDWLLLTKRIGNFQRMAPADWGSGYPNVWLGISVATQEEVARDVPKLIATRAAVRFLSCEPLLERVDLSEQFGMWWNQTMQCWEGTGHAINRDPYGRRRLDWVIVGGESGGKARPFALGWARDLIGQCRAAGAAAFIKQLGANPTNRELEPCPHIRARKGDDMSEWPADLRLREFPVPTNIP